MSKSLAGHIRYFKTQRLLTGCAFLAVSFALNAQPLPQHQKFELDQEFKQLLKQQQEQLSKGSNQSIDWGSLTFNDLTDEANHFIHEITGEAITKTNLDVLQEQASWFDTYVFVSYSMPDAELNEVLQWASGNNNIVVVMRGIPDGQSITEGVIRIQQLGAEFDPAPNIILDPTLFKRYDVQVVPTIVLLDEQQASQNAQIPINEIPNDAMAAQELLAQAKEKQVATLQVDDDSYLAKVAGISNPQWLRQRVAQGERGDLGKYGPVLEIAEVDLIEEMKRRVAMIDWEEKKENALKNYWPNQQFIDLEQTYQARIRRVDASVVATGDIVTPNGEFIARAGERVNPLDTRPFTQAVIVFDSTSPNQVLTVQENLERIKSIPSVHNVVYITTKLDKEQGWDAYKEITEQLQEPVYVLTPDIVERFALEYVPSVITADSTHFIIEELEVPITSAANLKPINSEREAEDEK